MWAEASIIYRTYAGEDAEFSENHTLETLRAVTSAASKIAIKGGSDAAAALILIQARQMKSILSYKI